TRGLVDAGWRRLVRAGDGYFGVAALPECVPACLERPHHQRAILRGELRAHRQGALVGPGVAQVLALLLFGCLLPRELSLGAHGALELRRGHRLRELE